MASTYKISDTGKTIRLIFAIISALIVFSPVLAKVRGDTQNLFVVGVIIVIIAFIANFFLDGLINMMTNKKEERRKIDDILGGFSPLYYFTFVILGLGFLLHWLSPSSTVWLTSSAIWLLILDFTTCFVSIPIIFGITTMSMRNFFTAVGLTAVMYIFLLNPVSVSVFLDNIAKDPSKLYSPLETLENGGNLFNGFIDTSKIAEIVTSSKSLSLSR